MSKQATITSKEEAQKLLSLIERRGFGPDMQIIQMLEHAKTINHVARALRDELLSMATGGTELLVDRLAGGWTNTDLLKGRWNELHHELSKIAMK